MDNKKMSSINKNISRTKEEQELFKALISLNLEESEKILSSSKNQFDFNKIKSKKGYGFLYTLLRRFNDQDFLVEDVDIDDLVKMLQLLFQHGLQINKETETCYSNPKYDFGSSLSAPVVTSLQIKDTTLAQLLIDNGADTNYEDSYGNIPLFFANHYNLAILYIEKTKNPYHVNKNGENALFYQVKNLRSMKFLIEYGLNPLLINKNGDNLVLHCVKHGTPDVLEYLLKTQPDLEVNYTNPITKETVLYTVKHKKMLDVLAKYGLDITVLNDKKENVLFTTHTKASFVKTLINLGLNINHQDALGDTILHKPNTEHLIEILAGAGFNFNLKNNKGDTVIDYYKKLNAGDLYSEHMKTIELIQDMILEQERLKSLKS